MNKSKSFALLAVISAVLILGVAYAAIGNVTMNVTGTAISSATEDASNFNVKFTGATNEVSGTGVSVTTDVTGGTVATYTVTGMKEVGDSATVVFTITNSSTDLKAVLSGLTTTTEGDTDYFEVTDAVLSDLTVDAEGGTQTLTVKVELVRASVTGKSITIKTSFTATPQDK